MTTDTSARMRHLVEQASSQNATEAFRRDSVRSAAQTLVGRVRCISQPPDRVECLEDTHETPRRTQS